MIITSDLINTIKENGIDLQPEDYFFFLDERDTLVNKRYFFITKNFEIILLTVKDKLIDNDTCIKLGLEPHKFTYKVESLKIEIGKVKFEFKDAGDDIETKIDSNLKLIYSGKERKLPDLKFIVDLIKNRESFINFNKKS